MSFTLEEIFIANPIVTNLSTDLMYFSRSPYTPGNDTAMTFADFSAQFGAAYTASALSKVDDTNVTLTLGGTPLTSLLQAVSLTLGWTGTLSGTRGGTGVNNGASTITIGGSFVMSGAFTFTGTLTGNTGITYPTSGTLATTAQLPTPAALSKVDDTNVTLTLGGTPLTSLLQAVSLTLGWTGLLSGTRGGTGVNNGASTITVGGSFVMSGAFTFTGTLTGNTSITYPTSGTLATTAQIPTGAALTKTDDTNVTLTLGGSASTALVNAASLTLGWTGTLGLARGGTNANLSATGGASQVLMQTSVGGAISVAQLSAANLSNGTTGSGSVVLATSPALTTPNLGTPSAINLTNATALPASALPTGSLFNFQQTQLTSTTTVTSTSPTMADLSLSVTITPTSASNKILVRAVLAVGTALNSVPMLQLVRGSTAIGIGDAAGNRTQAGNGGGGTVAGSEMQTVVLEWLDSPATTSATTYKVQGCTANGVAMYLNRTTADTNLATFSRTASVISAMEVKV